MIGGIQAAVASMLGAAITPPVSIAGAVTITAQDFSHGGGHVAGTGLYGNFDNPPTYSEGSLTGNTLSPAQVVAALFVQKSLGVPVVVVVSFNSAVAMGQAAFTSLNVDGLETVLSADASFSSFDAGGFYINSWNIPVTFPTFNAGAGKIFTFT